jgi:hypothetical protein
METNNTIAGCALGTLLLLMCTSTLAQALPPSSDSNLPAAVVQRQQAEIAKGDPARWYRADKTVAERLRTLRKEISAGLQETQGGCRKLATQERKACLDEAMSIYKKEMAEAPAMAAREAAADRAHSMAGR